MAMKRSGKGEAASSKARCLFPDELKQNHRNAIFCSLLAAAAILALFWVSYFTYNGAAKKYFRQQAYETMTEVSTQISRVVEVRVEYWYEQLEFLSRTVTEGDESDRSSGDYSALLDTINQDGYTVFDEVCLVTKDGTLLFQDGVSCDAGTDSFIQAVLSADPDDLLAGRLETQGISLLDDKVLFAMPIEAADSVAAIVAGLDNSDISRLLETDIFGGNMSYVVISDENGNVLVDTPAEKSFGTNLFDTFATFADAEVIASLKDGLLQGERGTLELMGVTRDFLTYYAPVMLDAEDVTNAEDYSALNWRLLILTRTDVLIQNISDLFYSSRMLIYSVLTLFGIVVLVFMRKCTRARDRNLTLQCVDTNTSLLRDSRFEQDARLLLGVLGTRYAVVSYNIVRFKQINTRIGHEKGDAVLALIGHTIRDFLRPDEIAAHSFADRFTVLLRMDTAEGEQRIRALERALMEADYPEQLRPRFTIGVFHVPQGNTDILSAMDHARLAQSSTREKQSIISNMALYTPEMNALQTEEGRLNDMAEGALSEGHFLVYYQLKRSLSNNRWAGCEALARWKDPELGFIYPGKFVPLFEKTGFIIKLDKYVFETVCRDLRTAMDEGETPVPVSVNLSKCHFEEDNYFDWYEDVLDRYQIPHELIEFEVTETLVAKDPDNILKLIQRLHAIGCKCSLDDFGTGYSSLSMVQDFEFDTIKLDRRFFYGRGGFTEDSALIVETLIQLSHRLHKSVVSEGIENADQVEFLRQKDCDMIQGFYFSRPAPVEECRQILRDSEVRGRESALS